MEPLLIVLRFSAKSWMVLRTGRLVGIAALIFMFMFFSLTSLSAAKPVPPDKIRLDSNNVVETSALFLISNPLFKLSSRRTVPPKIKTGQPVTPVAASSQGKAL
jgi:hypothetical protein